MTQWAASSRDYERIGEISVRSPGVGWGDVNTAWRHDFQNGHGNLNVLDFDGHSGTIQDTELLDSSADKLWRPIDDSSYKDVYK